MKRNAFRQLCGVVALLQGSLCFAQDDSRMESRGGLGVGLQVSTTGVGANLAYQFAGYPQLTARIGGSYLAYRQPFRMKAGDEGAKLDVSPNVELLIGQANLKWHPIRNSSFFLTGGAGYWSRPDVRADLRAREKITYKGVVLTPENIGTVRTSIEYKNLIPYAGFGFGRSVPRRKIGFGLELGAYHMGRPKVNFDYNGFLETTELGEQLRQIERDVQNYRWLPSLQLSLNYRL